MIRALAVAAGMLATTASAGLPDRPSGPVLDLAGLLNEYDRSELVGICHGIETSGKGVLVVAIVPSLEGDSVEGYAVRLFKEWGIGRKDTNNGVLLLVSMGDRKVRIETGYGVEPLLPDGRCGEIIRREIIPSFKRGEAAIGILRGAREIGSVLAAGDSTMSSSGSRRRADTWFVGRMLILLLFGGFLAGFGFAKVSLGRGWGWVAGVVGCGLALSAGYVVVMQATIKAAILFGGGGGALGAAVALPQDPRSGRGRRSGWWHGTGGWGGGFGGGGSNSFGGFGGGFSGGGGASGSW